MSRIKRKYWPFYLMGRQERRLRTREEIRDNQIAEKILAQEEASLSESIRSACEDAAMATLTGRMKSRWLSDHEDEIKESGGDPEEAYQAWCAGRVDELASVLESGVLDELDQQVFEEES